MRTEVLRMEHVNKVQHGRLVLDDFHIHLFEGEAVGVVGLNISGNAMLSDLFSGMETIDSGRIYVEETPVDARCPVNWRQKKVFCLREKPALIEQCSVAENMLLIPHHHTRQVGHIFTRMHSVRRQVQEVFCQFAVDIHPDMPIYDLPVLQCRIVELLSAYLADAKVIVLDLNVDFFNAVEHQELLRIIRCLCKRGLSFLLLDARFAAVKNIADRVVLLKNGRNLKTLERQEYDEHKVFGWLTDGYVTNSDFQSWRTQQQRLVFQNISFGNYLNGFSVPVQAGERMGIFDLHKCHARAIRQILCGRAQPRSGALLLDGKAMTFRSQPDALRHGLALLGRNAIDSELFFNRPMADNIAAASLRRVSCGLFIDSKRMAYLEKDAVKALGMEQWQRKARLWELDYYTRQKLFLSRWQLVRLRVLVCLNPMDIADAVTKELWKQFFAQKAQEGAAILIFGSDPKELIAVCDSVLIFDAQAQYRKYERAELLRGIPGWPAESP